MKQVDYDVQQYQNYARGRAVRPAQMTAWISAFAAQLFLSNHTIKTHISRIFAKTGSRDRAAAIGYAHRHHIG